MKPETFEASPELQAAMNDLLRAATHFALLAGQKYATIAAESYEAYTTLFKNGSVISDIRVQLSREERRVGSGFTTIADGVWHPVITLDALGDGQVPTAH